MTCRLAAEDGVRRAAEETSVRPEVAAPVLAAAGPAAGEVPAHAVRAAELVRRTGVSLAALFHAVGLDDFDPDSLTSAEIELKYGGYFARERRAAARLAELGAVSLPPELPYAAMRTLSVEARQKLAALRPATLAQAGRIPGVSPSDLQNLLVELERLRRDRSLAGASA